MAKKQTRRSVSIRGHTYEMIREYCERNNVSMSEFVEDRIAAFFSNGGSVQQPSRPSDSEQSKLSPDELQDAARYFTF